MSDNAFDPEKYFKQDLVSKKITSFSLGPIWLYFYRETLIGYRNMADEEEAYFLDASTPLPDDHYTSQHLITPALVKEAYDEAQSSKPPHLVSYSDLCGRTIQAGANSFNTLINKRLMGEK